jgi:hypothetical protein
MAGLEAHQVVYSHELPFENKINCLQLIFSKEFAMEKKTIL